MSTLVDRYRMRWMLTAALAQMVLCLWWGYNLDRLGPTWLFELSLGMCLGLIFGYGLALFPKVYGVRHVGEIRGRFGAACAVAGALGTVAFTYIDAESSDVLVLGVRALSLCIIIASWVAPWPQTVDEDEKLPAPSGR